MNICRKSKQRPKVKAYQQLRESWAGSMKVSLHQRLVLCSLHLILNIIQMTSTILRTGLLLQNYGSRS